MKAPASARAHRLRAASVAVVAAGALAVAGCGGDDAPAAAEGTAAAYVPAGAPFYVEVSTELDGPQWNQVRELGQLFPAYPDVQRELTEGLGSDDVDFEADVRPLLGERAAVAATSAEGLVGDDAPGSGDRGPEPFVGVVDLADGARADMEALLQRQGATADGEHEGATVLVDEDGTTVAAVNDDVMIVADTRELVEQALDANASGDDAVLSGSDAFNETVGSLPDEVFGLVYADAGTLAAAGADAFPDDLPVGAAGMREGHVGAAMIAEPEGIRFQGVTRGVDAYEDFTAFTPSLAEDVPGDAVFYAETADIGDVIRRQLEELRETGDPEIARQVDQFAQVIPSVLGITTEQLAALGDGQQAIAARPGAGEMPEAAVLMRVEDPAQATAALDALRQATPGLLGMLGDAGPAPAQAPDMWRQVPLGDGVTGWQFPLGDGMSVVYGVRDDLAAIGTGPAIVRDILSPSGEALSDSEAYTAAMAGRPDEVTGVTFVDMRGIVAAAGSAGAFADAPPDVVPNLRPLRSLAYWDTGGEDLTFEAFLRIGE